MDETDVGRVLAAAAPAPEAVPPVPDLSERARALGRRRRLRRTALTGGGAGVGMAALVGMVVALGGLGSGKAAPAAVSGGVAPAGGGTSSGAPARPTTPSSPATPTAPASSTPSRPKALVPTKGATPSFPKASDNQTADAALTAALTAALPPKWQGEKLFRAAETPGSYGAEYTWGSGLQETVLDLSATNIAPTGGGTPSLCQENTQQCTTGTATLLGHQVTWQYVATAGTPTMTVTESKGTVSYSYMFSGGSGTQLPGLDVMKDVALNDQVASALVAGIGSGH